MKYISTVINAEIVVWLLLRAYEDDLRVGLYRGLISTIHQKCNHCQNVINFFQNSFFPSKSRNDANKSDEVL